ncbi:MAG: glycosyltransferase family 2 protein [Acidobacteriota bacterium]|jgi:GT2 family glycosyltransferase
MQPSSDQDAADIIIPVHNLYARTRALLESIYRCTDSPFHIYVVDNASTDETADLHKIYARAITIVRNREDRGWSGAINQGIQIGCNPCLVFLDTGIQLAQGWLGNMISFLNTHPRIGAVGPLHSDDHHWQCAERVRENLVPQIPRFLTEDIHERSLILQYHFENTGILVENTLCFSCAVLRRRAVEDVGLLGEDDNGGSPAAYCRRLRKAGYVLGLSLGAYVNHDPILNHASLAGDLRHLRENKKLRRQISRVSKP